MTTDITIFNLAVIEGPSFTEIDAAVQAFLEKDGQQQATVLPGEETRTALELFIKVLQAVADGLNKPADDFKAGKDL